MARPTRVNFPGSWFRVSRDFCGLEIANAGAALYVGQSYKDFYVVEELKSKLGERCAEGISFDQAIGLGRGEASQSAL